MYVLWILYVDLKEYLPIMYTNTTWGQAWKQASLCLPLDWLQWLPIYVIYNISVILSWNKYWLIDWYTFQCLSVRPTPKAKSEFLETCDHWDIWSESWGHITWPDKLWKIWQLLTILTILDNFDNFGFFFDNFWQF